MSTIFLTEEVNMFAWIDRAGREEMLRGLKDIECLNIYVACVVGSNSETGDLWGI